MVKDALAALLGGWRTMIAVVGVAVVVGLFGFAAAVATGIIGPRGPHDAEVLTEAESSTAPSSQPPTSVTTEPRPTATAGQPRGDRSKRPAPQKVHPAGEALARAVEKKLDQEKERTPPEAPTEVPTAVPTQAPELPQAHFRAASFNVLGHSHTAPGGNKPGWASGPTRMRWTVQLLRGHDVDVVGFQELESIQHARFKQLTGGRFGTYPGPALGKNPIRNSIAWRTDAWRLVSARTIPIPYFSGNRVPMPYVLLEDVHSGHRVYFINIHNPASTARRGNNQRWRDLATQLEIGLVNRLKRSGVPVVLMGDFNERSEAFCRVTTRAGMNAANGGRSGNGRCIVPPRTGVDWIFGTPGIAFSRYLRQDGGLVQRSSDHPLILTSATVG